MNRDYAQLWALTESLLVRVPDLTVLKAVMVAERLMEIDDERQFRDDVERDLDALPTTEEAT